jgi:hypothetical protein
VAIEQNYETWLNRFRKKGLYSTPIQHICGIWVFTATFIIAVVYKGEFFSCLTAPASPTVPSNLKELIHSNISIGTTSAYWNSTTWNMVSLLKVRVMEDVLSAEIFQAESPELYNDLSLMREKLIFLNDTDVELVRDISRNMPIVVDETEVMFPPDGKEEFAIISEEKKAIFFMQLMSKVRHFLSFRMFYCR